MLSIVNRQTVKKCELSLKRERSKDVHMKDVLRSIKVLSFINRTDENEIKKTSNVS